MSDAAKLAALKETVAYLGKRVKTLGDDNAALREGLTEISRMRGHTVRSFEEIRDGWKDACIIAFGQAADAADAALKGSSLQTNSSSNPNPSGRPSPEPSAASSGPRNFGVSSEDSGPVGLGPHEGHRARVELQGWKLAMAVLQSDLYPKLADDERAECDAILGQRVAQVRADSRNVAGDEPGKDRETLAFIGKFAREACQTNSRDVGDWHDDMNYIAVVAERGRE